MSRYSGVDLDFGCYGRPRDRVEFDQMRSGPSGGRTITIFGYTFNPVKQLAERFAAKKELVIPQSFRDPTPQDSQE